MTEQEEIKRRIFLKEQHIELLKAEIEELNLKLLDLIEEEQCH